MMRFPLVARDALRGLSTQPLRSLISIAAISGLMTCLFILVNLNAAATKRIEETMSDIGPRSILAWVRQPYDTIKPMRPDNLDGMQHAEHDLTIIPVYYTQYLVKRPNDYAHWIATEPELLKHLNFELAEGMIFSSEHHLRGITIGAELAVNHKLKLNDTLWVENNGYRVLGILAHVASNPLIDFDPNQAIFSDYASSPRLVNRIEEFYIFYQAPTSLSDAKQRFEQVVKDFFGFQSVHYRDQNLIGEHIRYSIASLKQVLTWLSIFMVALSMIGIISQQWMAFLERRGECGMRLSLGARAHELFLLFLLESGGLGLLGASLGCVFGAIGLCLLLRHLSWPFSVHLELSAAAYFGCILLAMISGILPAMIAAKSEPNRLLAYH